MSKTKFIATNAILIALTIVFMAIPITVGPIRLAVLMLVPIVVASQALGFKSSLVSSAALGIMSCVFSLMFSADPLSILFRNPLVSILPRLFIGPVMYGVYTGFVKLMKNKKGSKVIASFFGTMAGVITNTVLVVAMMWALYYNREISGTVISKEFLSGLLALNFVIEITVCSIISPPIVIAVQKMIKGDIKRRSRKNNEDKSLSVNLEKETDKTA